MFHFFISNREKSWGEDGRNVNSHFWQGIIAWFLPRIEGVIYRLGRTPDESGILER